MIRFPIPNCRPKGAAMQLRELKARIRRLEELSRGFALEASRLRKDPGEFLHVERQRYFEAIQQAQACMERARVALGKVCTRLEEQARKRQRVITQEWGDDEFGT